MPHSDSDASVAVEGLFMKKKLGLLSAIALFGSILVPSVAAADPNCNCWWEEERNEYGDVVGGHWVCPSVLICQITVTPEG